MSTTGKSATCTPGGTVNVPTEPLGRAPNATSFFASASSSHADQSTSGSQRNDRLGGRGGGVGIGLGGSRQPEVGLNPLPHTIRRRNQPGRGLARQRDEAGELAHLGLTLVAAREVLSVGRRQLLAKGGQRQRLGITMRHHSPPWRCSGLAAIVFMVCPA